MDLRSVWALNALWDKVIDCEAPFRWTSSVMQSGQEITQNQYYLSTAFCFKRNILHHPLSLLLWAPFVRVCRHFLSAERRDWIGKEVVYWLPLCSSSQRTKKNDSFVVWAVHSSFTLLLQVPCCSQKSTIVVFLSNIFHLLLRFYRYLIDSCYSCCVTVHVVLHDWSLEINVLVLNANSKEYRSWSTLWWKAIGTRVRQRFDQTFVRLKLNETTHRTTWWDKIVDCDFLLI